MSAPLSLLGTTLVGLEHTYILALEMFLWTTPRARKTFNTSATFAEQTKGMAANQGLYNGFLAAGLFWSLVHPNAEFAKQIRLFFLGCVVVAGGYGGATVQRRILFVQAAPAAVAFGAVLLGV